MRPLEWQAAVRDYPGRPASGRLDVLAMLALRLDWTTGAGFVSIGQIAADAAVSASTVKRAIRWAIGAGLLVQTRRGHRLGNGQVMASEWRLSQPVTRDPLRTVSTGQRASLNGSNGPPQRVTGDPPSRPVFIKTCHSSARARVRDRLAAEVGATETEIDWIIEHCGRRAANPDRYLLAVLDNGDAAGWLARARADRPTWAPGYDVNLTEQRLAAARAGR